MTHAFVELLPADEAPHVRCDRGVSPISNDDREWQRPDRSLLLVDGQSLVARCSCWWNGTASLEGLATGAIGHYAAADAPSGLAVLARACEMLAGHGCRIAVGPMDGTTWRRYRFIVERGDEPVFFLEPDNPDEWPQHWTEAGFTRLATYSSAVNEKLERENPRTAPTLARLTAEGVRIRSLDMERLDWDLERIFRLSLAAFSGNFLYSPIGEEEFLAQYQAVLPFVRPDLVLLAERGPELLGFMFALPNALEPRDTIILKTMAVHPEAGGAGLGSALMDLAQRVGRRLGYRRAIHALIYETNVSGKISERYARTIRRYALFSRRLDA